MLIFDDLILSNLQRLLSSFMFYGPVLNETEIYLLNSKWLNINHYNKCCKKRVEGTEGVERGGKRGDDAL